MRRSVEMQDVKQRSFASVVNLVVASLNGPGWLFGARTSDGD